MAGMTLDTTIGAEDLNRGEARREADEMGDAQMNGRETEAETEEWPKTEDLGDGKTQLTYPDGSMYRGDVKDGKRHGWGAFCQHGDVQQGEWQDDKPVLTAFLTREGGYRIRISLRDTSSKFAKAIGEDDMVTLPPMNRPWASRIDSAVAWVKANFRQALAKELVGFGDVRLYVCGNEGEEADATTLFELKQKSDKGEEENLLDLEYAVDRTDGEKAAETEVVVEMAEEGPKAPTIMYGRGGKGTITYPNGDTYDGDILHRKRHGATTWSVRMHRATQSS